jgi:hypothetical protein
MRSFLLASSILKRPTIPPLGGLRRPKCAKHETATSVSRAIFIDKSFQKNIF